MTISEWLNPRWLIKQGKRASFSQLAFKYVVFLFLNSSSSPLSKDHESPAFWEGKRKRHPLYCNLTLPILGIKLFFFWGLFDILLVLLRWITQDKCSHLTTQESVLHPSKTWRFLQGRVSHLTAWFGIGQPLRSPSGRFSHPLLGASFDNSNANWLNVLIRDYS